MKKINFKPLCSLISVIIITAFTVGGCATSQDFLSTFSSANKKQNVALRQFKDIPIPNSAEINVEKTLVFGTEDWIGQLAVVAEQDPFTLYNFFRKNLPNHQWEEITAIRAPTSVLAYTRKDRVLTMQITSVKFGGSDILMTMSPKDPESAQKDG
jgi:hypothetical protein